MENDRNNEERELKRAVLSRIESENVSPRSRSWFIWADYSAWGLWFLGTFIGALAVAVTLFVVSYQQYVFYELTHDNLLTFVEDVLPILWFLILIAMIIFAVYNVRNTKRGYRYPLWQVLGSSLILSFAGGVIFHTIGIGFNFDKWLGGTVSGYESQEKMEERLWQNPEEGRLIGKFIKHEDFFPYGPVFLDVQEIEWLINTTDLREEELYSLESGQPVRMIGKVLAINPPYFHVCGVFPRLYEFNHTQEELKEQKEMIKKRLSHFYDNKLDNVITGDSLCAGIAPVQRLKIRFID